ncbi:MAG: hypothetical protein F6K41_10995 [Symploca sp. SIO3E6]|nr:hypothetical protein [Caldora sp. SIO3E6]
MASVDFSSYLKFVCTTPRYQETLSRYTATDAIHLVLEAQTVVRNVDGEMRRRGDGEKEKPRQQVEQFPVIEGLLKYAANHVLLSGKPGSGKSTTLKRLLLEMAQVALSLPLLTDSAPLTPQPWGEPESQSSPWEGLESQSPPELGDLGGKNPEEPKIPVLVQLKSECRILEAICGEFRQGQLAVSIEEIDNWLVEGKLFLLLDGVNEIPSEELRRQLQQFREDNPHTPMIFTTRDLAVGGDLGIEKKLEMRPLTEPQMREYVGKYLPEYGEVLLGQLQDRLREVAETPLLLKMLCEVFDPQTKQIPNSKGELFRKFDSKYNQHKQNPPVSGDCRRFQSEMLQHLAFEMLRGDREKPTEAWLTVSRSKAEGILETWLSKRGVSDAATKGKEWLEDLLEHHLLQVAANPREIEFHHQLFQEYYAAEALLVMLEKHDLYLIDDEQWQHFFLNYLKWTEPIALMLGLLENEKQAVRVVKLALAVDLQLGARLAGEVKSEFQQQTVGLIESVKVPKRWKFWFFTHKRWVSIPEWLRVKLLERTKSDVAIPRLLQAFQDEDYYVRWSAAEALGKMGSPEAISGLLNVFQDEDENYYVRWGTAKALGNLGSPEVIPELLKVLQGEDSSLRWVIANALGNLGSPKAIPGLFNALQDEDSSVRCSAAEALGNLSSPKVIPRLLNALQDEDSNVRWSAVEALGKLGSPKAIPRLLNALQDEDSNVRWSAAEALGNLGSPKAIPRLLNALQDEDFDVRRSAVEALGKLGSPKAIPGLLNALQDEDFDVRRSAVEALGKLGSLKAMPGLLNALQDEDSNVRRSAARALGKLGSPKAIPGLLNALQDEDSSVLGSTAEALGKLGSPEAIPRLLNALQDEDSNVRWSVTKVLGKLGSPEAIPRLLNALQDEDSNVRWSAVEALGKLGSPKAIPGLLNALQDEDFDVRWSAAEALGQIKQDKAAHILPDLLALIPNKSGQDALEAISNIQQNCQFYNYEIFCKQLPPVVTPQLSVATVTYNIDGEIVQIIEENKGTIIGEQNLKAQ